MTVDELIQALQALTPEQRAHRAWGDEPGAPVAQVWETINDLDARGINWRLLIVAAIAR